MKRATESPISIAHFLFKAIRPLYWQVLGLGFIACYWAINTSLSPYVIKLILDRLNLAHPFPNILMLLTFYIGLLFLGTLMLWCHQYLSFKFYPRLKANIIAEATKILSYYSYGFFQNHFTGGLTDKIKSLSKGTNEMVHMLINNFLNNILAFFIAFGTLMTVNPLLALLFLIWTGLIILLSALTTKKARLLSHQASEASSHVIGMIVDRFTNIVNVRLFSAHQHEENLLHQNLEETMQAEKNLMGYLSKIMSLQSFLSAIVMSSCILLLTFSVGSHHITIGDFAFILTLLSSFSGIIWNFSQEISHFSEVYGKVSQGIALLNRKVEIKDSSNAKALSVQKGEIRFQKVHFQYGNTEPLFSNKSIILHAGQKIGLVGYSGSGKSTFISLILRLFEISSGQILIDNQDISKITQDSLHKNIAMIPQEPTLFHRSLLENIRYGRLEASDSEVIEAAKKAHAHKFIERLPQKYQTLVGERGIKLSGGQRQRIAIARAILKNAPILILDEATSALDSVTENLIKESLTTLMENKTTLVIAHRLSTLLNMDRILVFDQGKIVEDGIHAELLTKKGYYKRLWDAQVEGFIPEFIS